MSNKSMGKDRSLFKKIAVFLILLFIYFIAGKFGLSFALFNKSASAIWLPTGIAMASLLILGYRYWPAIFIGAFIVNFSTTPNILVCIGIAAGNTFEGLLGAYFINKYARGKDAFRRVRSTFKFFLIAVLVPVVSASLGVFSLALGGFVNSSQISGTLITWFVGNVMGAALVVPLFLAFYNKPSYSVNKGNTSELILAFLILLIVLSFIFLGWPVQMSKPHPVIFICMPPLLWIAFRFGLRETMLAILITSVIAIAGTYLSSGFFVINDINTSLILLQLFIGTITATILTLSIAEHEYAEMRSFVKNKRYN